MEVDCQPFEELPFGIETNRLAKQKASRLDDRERDVYHWVLRRLADGRELTRGDLESAARERGIEPEAIAARLEEQDLVLFDPTSERLRSAYPFSGVPTRHEVLLDAHEQTVDAMCAIDALGMPYMLGKSATITSRDPRSGHAITVRVDVDISETRWKPSSAVVVTGAARGTGSIASLYCPVINFFESAESAKAFLEARDDVDGTILSIPEAVVAGRAFFEGLLG